MNCRTAIHKGLRPNGPKIGFWTYLRKNETKPGQFLDRLQNNEILRLKNGISVAQSLEYKAMKVTENKG